MIESNKGFHWANGAAQLVLVASLVIAMPAGGVGVGKRAAADWPWPVDDSRPQAKLMLDRLEYQSSEDEDALLWDAQAWYGGDYDRLWIETEGQDVVSGGDGGEIENFDVQYSRRISRYWDLQAGLGYQRIYGTSVDRSAEGGLIERLVQDGVERLVERRVDTLVERVSPRLARVRDLRGRYQDVTARYQRLFPPSGPDQDRAYAVVGLQGLAPYWFEVDTNLRLSEDGDAWVDLEAEYDWLLTQRLTLEPRFETSFAFTAAEDLGVGRGFTGVTAGLRLRYQVRREFAPYVGVSWQKKLGATADLARDEGESTDDLRFVVGLSAWF